MPPEIAAQIAADNAQIKAAWEAKPKVERLAFLQSQRRDVIAQIRRSIHTSRSYGCDKYLARLDRQIADLKRE